MEATGIPVPHRLIKEKIMIANFVKKGLSLLVLPLAAMLPAQLDAQVNTDTVNIYSARKQELIKPLLEDFWKSTGIQFNLVTGKADELLTRLELEADATPADLFITVDAGRLHRAKDAGVLQTVDDPLVADSVPGHLRDQDGYWVGLSKRARAIVYAMDRVDESELSTYEALTDPEWAGRICIRSSSNIYNQSLVASMIAALGVEETERWANGIVNNMARPPSGGDTDQIKAVAAGECDLAVVNSYYFGRLAGSEDPNQREIVEKLRIFWPNQQASDRGTHINVSGAGITKHAKNPEGALKLLRFLVSSKAQSWYSAVNHEFPVAEGSAISSTLLDWGDFREDQVNLSQLGVNNRKAVEIMDRAGWQ